MDHMSSDEQEFFMAMHLGLFAFGTFSMLVYFGFGDIHRALWSMLVMCLSGARSVQFCQA